MFTLFSHCYILFYNSKFHWLANQIDGCSRVMLEFVFSARLKSHKYGHQFVVRIKKKPSVIFCSICTSLCRWHRTNSRFRRDFIKMPLSAGIKAENDFFLKETKKLGKNDHWYFIFMESMEKSSHIDSDKLSSSQTFALKHFKCLFIACNNRNSTKSWRLMLKRALGVPKIKSHSLLIANIQLETVMYLHVSSNPLEIFLQVENLWARWD